MGRRSGRAAAKRAAEKMGEFYTTRLTVAHPFRRKQMHRARNLSHSQLVALTLSFPSRKYTTHV